VSSEKIFRAARWIAALSFLAMFGISYLPMSVPGGLIIATVLLGVASFSYMIFFKCRSCGDRYSSGKGFISVSWPFSGKCRKCGQPLGGSGAGAA